MLEDFLASVKLRLRSPNLQNCQLSALLVSRYSGNFIDERVEREQKEEVSRILPQFLEFSPQSLLTTATSLGLQIPLLIHTGVLLGLSPHLLTLPLELDF